MEEQLELEINKFDTLPKIVEQLELCEYECEGGPLRNDAAFIALKRRAESDGQPDERPWARGSLKTELS